MKNLRWMTLACLAGVSMSAVLAQPGGGAGPGPMGAGPAASAAGMGAGGPRGAARWGSGYTPGWSLMTPAERTGHQGRMLSMKTYEECKAYQDEHRELMAARAKERGGKVPPQPRRDACAGLKK